jgi:multiple sugar transport system permease protein
VTFVPLNSVLDLDAQTPRSIDAAPPPASRPHPRARRNRLAPILLIGPAMVGLAVLTYLPIALSLGAGFFSIPITGKGVKWVGFDNFVSVLSDDRMHQAAVNTLAYCALTIVPSVVIGLAAALAIEALGRGKALVSTLLFIPLTANLVAMAVVFRWIFAAPSGFANQVLAMVGVGPVDFLNDSHTALLSVALVGAWRSTSFAMVLFLAGLTTVPRGVHEASAMDGLRGVKKIVLVTVPMLRTTLVLVLVLTAIQSIQVFDTVNVMTDGGPNGSTETLFTLIWRTGFSYLQLGNASALTLVVLLVLVVIGLLRRSQITRGGE